MEAHRIRVVCPNKHSYNARVYLGDTEISSMLMGIHIDLRVGEPNKVHLDFAPISVDVDIVADASIEQLRLPI